MSSRNTSSALRPDQKKNAQLTPISQKRKRGRPRKNRTPEELAEIENKKKNKLTLAQKQEIKLQLQRQKEAERAAKGLKEIDESRFYVKNKDLIRELVKWKKSSRKVEDRQISEELGEMFLKIGNKMLNHGNFRNYPFELKQDMLMFGVEKIIKGLKNYNFRFSNPFAWISMAYWNAFLTSIYRHYKQLNIKRDLMKKLYMELQTYSGIDPRSSLNKAIKTYLGDDIDCD